MSAVFTEGPWEAKAVGHDLRVYAGSYKICGGVDHNGNPENQANARLIAAAPELYEAARLFVEEYDAGDQEDSVALMLAYNAALEAAKSALRKARGELA